jgi:hypothetical protein
MKTMPVQTLSKAMPPEPMLEHAIRLRAYELYARRGMAEGHAVHDWLAAEAELLYDHPTTAADLTQKKSADASLRPTRTERALAVEGGKSKQRR